MKRILILIIGLIGVAYGQSAPTSAKTRFVNGLYVGTKLDSYFNAADSNAIYWRADSVVMAKYKGTARALAFAVSGGYLHILDTAAMLSGYKTYYPRTAISAGTGISYNAATGVITNSSPSSGGTVTSVATNNGSGITGGTITSTGTIAADTTILSTKANVVGLLVGYTTTAANALKLNISDTATMLSNYRRTTTKITNSDLTNSAITINGSSTSLGGSISVGTVTSVSAGTGMSFTTITSTGAVNADTTVLATRAYASGLDVGKANTSLNNVNGVLSSTYGGAGSVSGILKANGSGTVSAAVAGTDYVAPSALSGYLPLSGGTLTGALASSSTGKFGASGSITGGYVLEAIGNLRVSGIIAGSGNLRLYGNSATSTNYLEVAENGTVTAQNALNGTSAAFSGATQLATSSGRVLIKTTTDNGTDALQVAGSGNFSGGATVSGFGSITNAASRLNIDFAVGNSRFYSLGANTSTKGGFEFHTNSSDGSLDVTALSIAGSTGAITASSSVNATAFLASSHITITKDGSNAIGAGPHYQFTNMGGTRSWVSQLNASNNIDWWYFDGTTWATPKITFTNTGAITASSSVTANSFVKGAGFYQPISYKTANYTLTVNDYTVIFDVDAANRTATLPAGVEGQIFNIGYNSTAGNQLTIVPNGSETIAGGSSYIINSGTCIGTVTIQFLSGNWYIIATAYNKSCL